MNKYSGHACLFLMQIWEFTTWLFNSKDSFSSLFRSWRACVVSVHVQWGPSGIVGGPPIGNVLAICLLIQTSSSNSMKQPSWFDSLNLGEFHKKSTDLGSDYNICISKNVSENIYTLSVFLQSSPFVFWTFNSISLPQYIILIITTNLISILSLYQIYISTLLQSY